MNTLPEIEEIQAQLLQAPHKAHRRFEALLTQAQSRQNIAQAECLALAAESLAADNPYLRQWHTYTLGYLALVARGRPDEAATHLESLRAENRNLAPGLQDRVLNGLGIVYERQEQWDRAMQCYQECITLCETEGNDLGLGKALFNLAIIHYKGLDYAAVVSCTERSIALLSQNPNDQVWQTNLGRAWNEYGLAQMQLGHLTAARDAFEKYLDICIRWNYRVGEGFAYTNLGHIHLRLDDILRAREYYTQSRDILSDTGNTFEAAEAIYGLAHCAQQMGASIEQVRELFDAALAAASEGNNHEITTQIFLDQADLYERTGNLAVALQANRQAVETVESLRANIVLPEARIRLQGSRIEAYEQVVSRLCQSPAGYAEAFRYVEMSKSRALIEILAGRSIRPPENVPAAWLEQETELRHSLQTLYRAPSAQREQIAAFEQELDQLRQRIRLCDAEFDSFQTVAPLSLDEVMARLPEGGVLLEYFVAGDTILAFVITSTAITVTHLPLRLRDLELAFTRTDDGKLGQLRNLPRGADHRLRQPWILNKLSQTLLEPLGETVWSAPLLCIVPHGLLHYIPFHALYQKIGSGPRYLLENDAQTRRIIYAPSATTLFDHCQRKTPSSQTGCLAIGYNDLALNLSQAEIEARMIAQITGGKSWTGTAATCASLFDKGTNYRYLHFSCHSWFNPAWPMSSSLSLADGPLDVTDILYGLRLDADLVCLSACETGRSHVLRGDELVGLVRAFLYAGTPSVIVSHWVVNELSTRLLMEHFYRELTADSNQARVGAKAGAVNRAQNFIKNLTYEELRQMLLAGKSTSVEINQQLQYLATSAGYDSIETLHGDECLLAHPYHWAPFFLVGDRLI